MTTTTDNTSPNMVAAHNAMMLNDNYRVQDENGLKFHMEHNPSEAEALARWLRSRGGEKWSVVRIPVDTVKAARAIRANVLRHPLRLEALQDTGVI